MGNINQLIGCCGLNCKTCDARIATLTNDKALREKTAALWNKAQRGNDYTRNDQLHQLL